MKWNGIEPFQYKDAVTQEKYFSRVLFLSKISGIFPFSLKRGHFRISVPWFVLSAVMTFFVVCVSIYNVMDNCISGIVLEGAPKLMARPTFRLSTFCTAVFYVVFVSSSYSRIGSYHRILRALGEVDGLLRYGGGRTPDRPRLASRQVLGGMSCALIFVYCPWKNWFGELQRLYFCQLAVSMWLSAEQFAAFCCLIDGRIAEACDRLTELRLNVHLRIVETRKLSTVHNKICDVCSLLESVFSRLLTLNIGVIFLGIVNCTYMIYNWPLVLKESFVLYLLPGRNYKDVYVCLLSAWLCLYASGIWQIAACALEISKKVRTNFAK